MLERLLIDAGIGEGMHVLDVGCGHGTVSRMAARLVGAGGRVVGIDREPAALAHARAQTLESSQLCFVEADIDALPPELGPFDAIIGRRVLMYQRDPAASLQQLATRLRAGGLAVFQEHDATMVPAASVPVPLHERVHRLIWATVEREGATLHMGLELPAALERAGLQVEHVRAEAIVHTPTRPEQLAARSAELAMVTRYMVPRMLAAGVAESAQLEFEELELRLADELVRTRASWIGDMVFGAWARKPG
ncbi:MAG: methyltransferase domain-containing protein [Myxococcales bacterium]|nr:methyltransferase domain-containing protein [Myxococcales bacterium]